MYIEWTCIDLMCFLPLLYLIHSHAGCVRVGREDQKLQALLEFRIHAKLLQMPSPPQTVEYILCHELYAILYPLRLLAEARPKQYLFQTKYAVSFGEGEYARGLSERKANE